MQVSTAPAPSEQPVVVPPPRPRQRWRSLVATLLIVIGCILAPLAGVAVWAKSQVTDTDRYVATVAPLASDPAIQNAVADKVTAADQVRLVFSNGVCGRTGICAIKGSTRPTRSMSVRTPVSSSARPTRPMIEYALPSVPVSWALMSEYLMSFMIITGTDGVLRLRSPHC